MMTSADVYSQNGSRLGFIPGHHDNGTSRIVIGAQPSYFAQWSLLSKFAALSFVVFVIVANSVVIAIYHTVHRRATMHEIHVCHLAVCDLLASLLATFPVLSGQLSVQFGLGQALLLPCFVSALSTLGCNVMATIICNIISYDRLRLLQLGIRYHMVQSRMSGLIRLTVAWTVVVCITITIAISIVNAPLSTPVDDCAYVFESRSLIIKSFMTIAALGPLTTLIVLNCMVRTKVRELEDRHPLATTRTSFTGRTVGRSRSETAGDVLEADNSTGYWTREPSVVEPGPMVAQQSLVSTDGAVFVNKTDTVAKKSFKSSRSLSRRATASIFMSTLTFILCLSPLTILLLIEAWSPGTITTSTHRWHLWLTLARTAVDPFLFARSIPSFRLAYGTSVIKLEQRWRVVHWSRRLCCLPLYLCDRTIVADAQERLDRKRRGSPIVMRSAVSDRGGDLQQDKEQAESRRQSLQLFLATITLEASTKTVSTLDSDQRLALGARPHPDGRRHYSTEV